MNCPRCGNAISSLGQYCGKCGHDFGEELYDKFSFYFGLKDEFEKLTNLQNSLYAGIANVSVKIQKYEEVLKRDLEHQTSSLNLQADRPRTATGPEAEVPSSPPASLKTAAQENVSPGVVSPSFEAPKIGSSEFEVNLGQKWLLIIGILAMVFGVGYFLKYSFEQGWVGPAGRVAAAYLWGMAFLAAGDRFRKKIERFGLSLIGGGIAVLYFATFAGFQVYHLMEQSPSFLIMVLITVLAGSLAVYYNAKWLAVLGTTGGFLTPVLLATGQDNQIVLMTYMTILNFGLLGMAFHKKWDILNTLGFFFTYLLYSGWFMNHYTATKFWPAIIFLNIFYLIYSIAPFAYQFLEKTGHSARGYFVIVPNSFIAFAFSYSMIVNAFSLPWVSVITLFYSCVFLAMASVLVRKEKQDQEAFVVLLAKAALFLIITIPVIFSRHWITIFWSAQALILLLMGIKLGRKTLVYGAYMLLGVTVGKFLFYDYIVIFRFDAAYNFSFLRSYADLLLERFITTITLLAALYLAGLAAAKSSLRSITPDVKDSSFLFSVWGALLFIVFNIEISGFFHDYLPAARFAAHSVLWTVFAVVLMIKGVHENKTALRRVSFGLFLVTILKVFLFDMSNVSTPYRIVSFIILGLVLVGTSYLYYRFKDRLSVQQDMEK